MHDKAMLNGTDPDKTQYISIQIYYVTSTQLLLSTPFS
jgi:hypothetical protein